MASTTATAVSLALLIACINMGFGMVVASGYAAQMGVDDVGLGIGNDIEAAQSAVQSNEFTPVAIGSAFAGFTINGVKVLVKVIALLAIGIPAILYTAGAPVWIWGPVGTICVMIQGIAAMGLYFNPEV